MGKPVSHCDVGNHDLRDEMVLICASCGRKVCRKHQGNKRIRPGGYVSCPDCVEIVAGMNSDKLARWRSRN